MKLFYHKSLILRRKLKFGLLFDIFGALLFTSLAILLFSFFSPHSAQASWYDENWLYRQAIPVTNSTSVQTNVYINFSGLDGTHPFIDTSATAKFKSNCGDIRFIDSNGKSLPYFISSGCGTASTVIHVQFPSLPAGIQTIYMYYGNPATNNGFSSVDFSTEATSYSIGTAASEEKGPGPASYWKFDEGYGASAHDSMPDSNTGVISGGTWLNGDQCISEKCIKFAGTGASYMRITNANLKNLSMTGAFTASLWVKHFGSAGSQGLVAKDARSNGNRGFFFEINTSNKLTIVLTSDGTTYGLNQAGTKAITTGTWHHVVVTFNPSTAATFYIDGQRDATFTSSIPASVFSNTASFEVGTSNTGDLLNGAVDDVKIYNYVRSAAQISQDYQSGLVNSGTKQGTSANLGSAQEQYLSSGLAGYWKMDESNYSFVTNEVVDSSGNANHGNAGNANAPTFGTSTGGNSTTTLKDTGKTWATNVFAGDTIKITGGTGIGQIRQIASNTLDTITVSSAWTTPDATSTYVIVATTTTGKFGNGGYFDGSYGYLTFNSTATLQITGSLTLSAWINLTNTSSIHDIIAKNNSVGSYAYRLYTDTSGLLNMEVSSDGTALTTITGVTPLSSSIWYHVIGTYDPGKSMRVFVNGIQDGISTTSIPIAINNASTAKLEIGAQASGSTYNFFGIIDEARVYNRAFSPSEALGLASFATSPSGRWDFEDGAGSSVNDSSGSSNIGTWQGTLGSQWSQGKYGKGGNFNGSNNYVSVANTLSGIGTISFWVNPNTTTQSLLDLNGSAYITVSAGTISTTGFTSPTIYVNGIVTSTLVANIWQYVTVTTNTSLSGSAITFGRANGAFLTGKMDGVVIYNYARTQKQIVSDMNAFHPNVGSPVGSPVGYWKIDEGSGSTVNNSGSTGSIINGTITNSPTWTNSGKFGKALSFTSASLQYVSIPDDVSLKPTNFSLTFWVMKNSEPANLDQVFAKHNAGKTQGWGSSFDSSATRKLYTAIYNTAGTEFNTSAFNTALPTLTWRHYSFVFNGTSVATYENGIYLGSITFTGTFTPDTNALIFAANRTNNGNFAPITLDEVKLYNYALTSDEVKLDMNRQSSEVLGALSDNISAGSVQSSSQAYCVPGDSTSCTTPTVEWKFDEGSGTTSADTSGNANTATLDNTPIWSSGKFGKALLFDGNTTNVHKSSFTPPAKTITLEAWVYPKGLGGGNLGRIFQHTNFILYLDASSWFNFESDGWSTTNGLWTTPSNSVVLNRWTHVVVTFDGTSAGTTPVIYINGVPQTITQTTATSGTQTLTSGGFGVGNNAISGGNRGFNGYIDNAIMYSYVRTPAQVAWDYNHGGPTGWWKMDECQGSTVNDSSGNGYSGTIALSTTGTQTTSTGMGTCATSAATPRFNGASGKINYSVNLDGTDDNITTGSISPITTTAKTYTTASWGGWFYPTTSIASKTLTEKATEFQLTTDASSKPICGVYYSAAFHNSSAPTPALTLNTWNHVLCTYDGTNVNTYLNGILVKQSAETNAVTAASSILYMGETSAGANFYSGQLDDIRIYDYALTAAQIRILYNEGGINFSPSIGAP